MPNSNTTFLLLNIFLITDVDTQHNEVALDGMSQEIVFGDEENLMPENSLSVPETKSIKRIVSPLLKEIENTPQRKRMCLTEIKKKNISNLSNTIIKRKNQKQMNEDAITTKRLEILDIQRQQELMKLEKTKILLDMDIEFKKILLENAKMDLEFKRRNFQLCSPK